MRTLLGLFFIFFSFNSTTAQCAFDNTFNSDATPSACPGSFTASCINGGESLTLTVISGMQYTISTCGGAGWDTQLSIYDITGTIAYAYNDDACGLQSSVSFVATGNGTVNILLDEYYCLNTGTCADITITCSVPPPPVVLDSSNLPIVVINTVGGAAIPNEPKIDATMGIIYNGEGVRNYITDPFNEFEGNIGIEIRGSSSSGFPKKQWGLETRDPSGNSNEVSIFNMAYDNDWVLYAPYSDKSLIRNFFTYKMGWDTEQYAPRTKLCEVILNGDYQGVYVFTEKIKRKDGKVGIDDVMPEDIIGNELTGDYILKVDKLTAGGQVAWISPYPPYVGASATVKMQLHDPDLDSLVPVQLSYIQNAVTAFEAALDGPNFTDPVLGYAPFIDVESFVDFMLVNEFGKNVDGYRISTFFHKRRDSEGGKIVAGPLWDFNLAWGNANYCQGGNTAGWEIDFYNYCAGDGLQNPFWWEKLVQDPVFAKLMHCRWKELRQGKWHTDTLMAYIDTLANYLDESQQRNFQDWQILGTYVWPNNFVGNTYAEEIDYLKTWITDRAIWMDANMFGSCDDLGFAMNESSGFRVFPNPARDQVTIESPYLFQNAELILYDVTGNEISETHLNDQYKIQLNLKNLSPGIYYYKLVESNTKITTGKITIQ